MISLTGGDFQPKSDLIDCESFSEEKHQLPERFTFVCPAADEGLAFLFSSIWLMSWRRGRCHRPSTDRKSGFRKSHDSVLIARSPSENVFPYRSTVCETQPNEYDPEKCETALSAHTARKPSIIVTTLNRRRRLQNGVVVCASWRRKRRSRSMLFLSLSSQFVSHVFQIFTLIFHSTFASWWTMFACRCFTQKKAPPRLKWRD